MVDSLGRCLGDGEAHIRPPRRQGRRHRLRGIQDDDTARHIHRVCLRQHSARHPRTRLHHRSHGARPFQKHLERSRSHRRRHSYDGRAAQRGFQRRGKRQHHHRGCAPVGQTELRVYHRRLAARYCKENHHDSGSHQGRKPYAGLHHPREGSEPARRHGLHRARTRERPKHCQGRRCRHRKLLCA